MKKIILPAIVVIALVSNNIAAQSWSALGPGIGADHFHTVNALTSYNGELFAGGYFSAAGVSANNIAKWNGANWSPVSSGISGLVYALTVYDGNLYAGGSFNSAGGIPASGIAKWNGTNWSAVGSANCSGVRSIASYNNELFVAGYFPGLAGPDGTCIAKWNGANWSVVGTGIDSIINLVECLAVYNGELYAAGAYIGGGGVASYFSIVKWDGFNWSTLITIPASITLDGVLGDILSMTVYNSELYVAGSFAMMIDTTTVYQIAKWNGTSWSAVGTGINPGVYPIGGDSDGAGYSFIQSLTVCDGALYAGGHFDSSGTIATRNIAKWDGTSWSALGQGVNGYVYNMFAADTSLYVGGWFNYVNGIAVPARNIARWGNACTMVPAVPDPITGNTAVCQNSLQIYSVAAVPGAISYTWMLPSGWAGNSTTNNITATAGAAGGIVAVTANSSCATSIAQTLAVTVNRIPLSPDAIVGNNSICENSLQTYSVVTVPGATGYTWTLPSGWIGTSATSTITTTVGSSSGNISVSANNSCGSSDQRTLPVQVNAVPLSPTVISGYAFVNTGQTTTYSINAVAGADGYSWTLSGGGNIKSGQNTQSIIVEWQTPGTYMLTVKASNNCGTSSGQTITVQVSATASNDPFEIKLLPNPSSGIFFLKAKKAEGKSIEFELRDLGGHMILRSGKLAGTNDFSHSLDLRKFAQGIYIINVSVDNKLFSRKIAIMKG